MARIFISYRREDSIAYAGRLYDRLKAHFGESHVFMDITSLKPGEDFAEALKKTIASCDALIAIIGAQWLRVKTEDGRARLDDPADFVRFEIGTALERGIPVIPVLVAGAQMPRASDLPDTLKQLAGRQALVETDIEFEPSVARLIQTLDAIPNPEQKGRKRQKKRFLLVAVIAVIILAIGALIFVRTEAKKQLRFPKILSPSFGRVDSVAFSPNGRLLATAGERGTVAIWDPASAKLLRKYSVGELDANSVVFNPDGRWLASAGQDHAIKIADPANGEIKVTLSVHSDNVTSVTFSPDGRKLASASLDNTIAISDMTSQLASKRGSGGAILTWPVDALKSVAYSHDGHLLASADYDATVKIWNPGTGALLRTMSVAALSPYMTHVECIAFSPDGKWLASGSYHGSVEIWDPANGRLLRSLTGRPKSIDSIAFSPDGRRLAAGGDDHLIRIWDPGAGKLLGTLAGHAANIQSVVFSPDGVWLASGDQNGAVNLWHLPTLLGS